MSLSDCEKCWNTPCTCGWDYYGWNIASLERHISVLSSVLQFKKENPSGTQKEMYDYIKKGGA